MIHCQKNIARTKQKHLPSNHLKSNGYLLPAVEATEAKRHNSKANLLKVSL